MFSVTRAELFTGSGIHSVDVEGGVDCGIVMRALTQFQGRVAETAARFLGEPLE